MSESPESSHSFKTLLSMLGHHKASLTGAIVFSVLGSLMGLAQPMLINQIIDKIGQPMGMLIALLVGLLVLSSVASGLEWYLLTRTAEAAVFATRRDLVSHLLRLPITSYDKHRTGDLVTRVGSDTTLVRTAFTGGLVQAVSSVLTIVGSIILMALIDVTMLLVVLSVIALTLVAVVFTSRLMQKYTKRAQEAVGELGAGMDKSLVAVRTVRASRAEERVEKELHSSADRAYHEGVKMATVGALLNPVSGLALQGSFLIVLGIGGARVASGTISVADLVSFVLYMFMASMPLGMIFSAIATVRQAMGAIDRINNVLDEPLEDSTGKEAEHSSAISFDSVSFSYDGKTPVLEDVSFDVQPGTKTALVGPSGGGKSTTLALMERFYDPTAGTIYLGDQDMSELSRESVRAQVGYVEQEAAILAGTVRENLKLANFQVTDEECWATLDQVNLRDRFEDSEGLDTILGDRGVSLSGGQRQRLALARMLLMDSPILVLDEPTSAVDSHNEQLILDAIAAAGADKTVIIVAHRLSTVTDADQILVIDDSKVQARGTHEELLETSELYQELASRQLLA
ncbi:ABC transporter ATP-binding protein [Corynebacterium casei]|uniref:ABC transporter ATP-binding protein n=1 Tax=Corynebacterium casei TaxID=160386 RepID=UPI002647E916|nr:ABC transporter ATP-binding protein [Corynebacterium casei]MDN5740483.1 ABC transporter ATP-binding protein/permease [Corynebacterium casei]MDN5840488.1 ABC transporter ATP-binding protein/permease [Corynebacterium casei]MDN6416676.1 ABC transporter ATP-binding protein/permease [Corynebacterium casei]MDN6464392.1 ABC transporter ATP-binding protein/permease [Corynebacterium casei]MDN6495316.1 ABC transporter ATP-binding protein/permease [Corynebacterium casei]